MVSRCQGGDRHGPKSPETLEEWAVYGIGEPDEDGLYPDYRVPPELKPAAAKAGKPVWWGDILANWNAVVLDLSERHGVDLYDPAVLARPWPGVRSMILGLLQVDSRLANAMKG